MKKYAKVRVEKGRYWLIEVTRDDARHICGYRVNKEGERMERVKGDDIAIMFFIGAAGDKVSDMQMNLMYAELEEKQS